MTTTIKTNRVTAERSAASVAGEPPAPAATIPTERLRKRAFEIFRARTSAPGDSLSDWVRAEREITCALQGCDGDARANAIAMLPGRIRARAFQICQQRAGDQFSDWLAAEHELGAVPQASPAPARPAERHGVPETPKVRVGSRGRALLRSGD